MRRLRKAMPAVLIPFFLNSCMLLSGRCLYETRNVIADGTAPNGTTSIIAQAKLILGEQRDYQPDKVFSWQITGPDLKGHVTKIALRDNAAPGTDRYVFEIVDAARPDLSSGAVTQNAGANLNGLFDLLSSKRAIVVITTDIPGQTTVTIPLLNATKDDWSRPYCS